MLNSYSEWAEFLGRNEISVDQHAIRQHLRNKRILITGAGGSIGSALAKHCAQLGIESLVLLDIAERGIYELENDLARSSMPQSFIVGDICDSALLNEVCTTHQPQIIFHAAACKHVPLMERNPFTAVRANAVGTHLIAQAAARHKSEQLILLSTDKAVDASSIMGAAKRIAERIILANTSRTQMKAVRLGNVLGSSGSVVPLFLRQIAAGGPVTVTHPDATRYFITMDEAVWLLLSAILLPDNAAVFVSDGGKPRGIEELARFLMKRMNADCIVQFTQLRAGEKLHEQMIAATESSSNTTLDHFRRIDGPHVSTENIESTMDAISQALQQRNLENLLHAIHSEIHSTEFAGREP